MTIPLLTENIPSQQKPLIDSLRGQKLVKLVRYSWDSKDEVVREYGIKSEQVFSLTAGPLLMYFESGLVVGASSNPSKNSVVLWVERNEEGDSLDELTEDDDELYPIDAKEQPYFWIDLLGKSIEAVRVIYRTPVSSKMKELPNEVGLAIRVASGLEFILSHGLHDNSDDFSVVTKDQINSDLKYQLVNL